MTIDDMLNTTSLSVSAKKDLENALYDFDEQLENWIETNKLQKLINRDASDAKQIAKQIDGIKYGAFLDIKCAYEDGKPSSAQIQAIISKALNDLSNVVGSMATNVISSIVEKEKNEAVTACGISKAANIDLVVIESKENDTILKDLSLEDLVTRFISIGKQAQLQQGLILLELRNRFSSDKEFGQWVSTRTKCSGSPQQHTRLMNFARFFSNRDIDGISISAAYEISAPKNADVAEETYKRVYGKSLTVAQVTQEIENLKSSSLMQSEDISIVDGLESKSAIVTEAVDIENLKRQLLLIVEPVPINVVKLLFKDCISELKINAK